MTFDGFDEIPQRTFQGARDEEGKNSSGLFGSRHRHHAIQIDEILSESGSVRRLKALDGDVDVVCRQKHLKSCK